MIGLKFIPLRTPGGECTSHIGLFVNIEIKALRHKQASASGKCPQDLDSSFEKFSVPDLAKTCYYSESFENTTFPVDHCKKNGNQKLTHSVSNNSADGDHDLLRRQPQLFRQGAINEFTVEVHPNNNKKETDDSYV